MNGRRNIEFRRYAKENGVYLWEVAEQLNVTEYHLSRLLRHELPEDKTQLLYDAANSILKERKEGPYASKI